jgi:hypothetical protein
MRVTCFKLAVLGALGFAGCTGETSTPAARVVTALREVGSPKLRRDAETVAARVRVHEQFGPTKIPDSLWTESIRSFSPVHVYWGSDHLTIVTRESGRYQNGIRVYFPLHPDDSLAAGAYAGGGSGGGDYEMEPGVYWFWQKIRSNAALLRKLQDAHTNDALERP